jgi:hypothetical protein
MSDQMRDKSKAETKTEKPTDATAVLSPEELRAISGGSGTGTSGGGGTSTGTGSGTGGTAPHTIVGPGH